MSTTTGQVRHLAVLKLPRKWGDRVTDTGAIINECIIQPDIGWETGFLTDAAAQHTKFAGAHEATKTRAAGTVAVRNSEWNTLNIFLVKIQNTIQDAADANPAMAVEIITKRLLKVKTVTSRGKQINEAKNGMVSGTVILFGDTKKKVKSHGWKMSLDGITYTNLDPTSQARTMVQGLTAGTKVYFIHRWITIDGPSDWSEPFSVRVN